MAFAAWNPLLVIPTVGAFAEGETVIGNAPVSGVVTSLAWAGNTYGGTFLAFALRSASGQSFAVGSRSGLAAGPQGEPSLPDFVLNETTAHAETAGVSPIMGAMPVQAGEELRIVFRSTIVVVAAGLAINGSLTIESAARVSRGMISSGPTFDTETREIVRRTRPPVIDREPPTAPGAEPGPLIATRDIILQSYWEFPRVSVRGVPEMPLGFQLAGPINAEGPPTFFARGSVVPEIPESPAPSWVFIEWRPQPGLPSGYIVGPRGG
jgi:hypothetical protein